MRFRNAIFRSRNPSLSPHPPFSDIAGAGAGAVAVAAASESIFTAAPDLIEAFIADMFLTEIAGRVVVVRWS